MILVLLISIILICSSYQLRSSVSLLSLKRQSSSSISISRIQRNNNILYNSNIDDDDNDDDNGILNDMIVSEIVRSEFTGPGCVLLAQKNEFDHFLCNQAVFIYEHGPRGTCGVILERPTAFTMGETSPNIGIFAPNTLFMGGGGGEDTALMFHKYDLSGYSKYVGGGIYLGGIREARQLLEDRKAHPKDFKFIFNNVQWQPGQLDQEIKDGRWDIVRIPYDMVLRQDITGSLWNQARRNIELNDREVEK